MLTTSEQRAATISAPKSVSLAALIGGDDRIRDAYRESVKEALKEFGKYLQARGGGPPSRQPQTIARNEPRSRDQRENFAP